MRYEVRKYLFIGASKDRDRFFARAQEAGVVEFIDTAKTEPMELPPEIHAILSAKKVLRRLEPAPQEELDELEAADFIAQRVLEIEEHIERLREEKRLLTLEITRVQPFGDFAMEDLSYIEQKSGRVVQFFFAKQAHPLDPETARSLIHVGSAFDLDYYVALNEERKSYPGATEMRIDRPLGVLRKRLAEADIEFHEAEAELKTYAKRRDFLQRRLLDKLNQHHFSEAQAFALGAFDEGLFVIQGWAPPHCMEEVAKIAEELSVYCSEIAIDRQEHVPTYLENKRLARVGEDIVHVYDTPSTHDRDPSRWVLGFFAFFFGVIVSDAGYGLILLAITLYLVRKFWKRKGLARRFLTLCLILSGSCIVWGTLTTSFFGIPIDPDNPLRKISLTDWLVHEKVEYVIETRGELYKEWLEKFPKLSETDTVDGWLQTAVRFEEGKKRYFLMDRFTNNALLEIALLIGAIHISLAFLRMLDRNWAGLGWVLFIVGGYLYFPSLVGASSFVHYVFGFNPQTAAYAGFELIWIGLGLAIVLGIIQHKLRGIAEVANVIQVFADVLSYLRLYALGLASVMMSITFNDLAIDAGIVFGTLIVIFGHSVNITLSIMGGVIHGLRLNYLEWYRHCFEGGGRMLRPLELLHFNNP